MNVAEVRRLLAQLEAETKRLQPTPLPELWPCHACGNPGVRNLGSEGYCSAHLMALYATFGPEAWVDGGIGLQSGKMRPEYGPLEADLRCVCCGATWVGIVGDPCGWCQRAIEIQKKHQAELDAKRKRSVA